MILAKNRLQAAWKFHQNGDLDTAEAIYRTVIRDFPKSADAWTYFGMVLNDQCRFEEALAAYDRALAQSPKNKSALTNSGLSLAMTGQHEQALRRHQQAIAIDPKFARGRTNLGIQLLRMGDTDAGWKAYADRTQTAVFSPPNCKLPFWRGENLKDSHLIIHGEQGLGDEVQTFRYLQNASKLAHKVTLSADGKLLPLFRRSAHNVSFVDRGSSLPDADFQVCAFDLPDHFGFGENTPYLTPDPASRSRWESHFAAISSCKIGINWTGNNQNPMNRLRSFPLATLLTSVHHEDLHLVSLQATHGLAEMTILPEAANIEQVLLTDDGDARSIDEMASIIGCLDLVITCDSLCAHLAAALGVETWLLLAKVPDWRWGLNGQQSPWYSSVKIYRQTRRGDWQDVCAELGKDLSVRCSFPTAS